MNKKPGSMLSLFLSVIVWLAPILSMFPNLFSIIPIQEKITLCAFILIIVTAVFILISTSFFLAGKSNSLKRTLPRSDCNKCDDILCCLKAVRPGVNYKDEIFKLNSNNLIDEFELATIEASIPIKEIWIISPDLSYECEDTFFTEVVRRNLKNGVRYKYFTQNCSDSRENARRLYSKYTKKISRFMYRRKLIFYLVDAREFDIILSLYSIVVYNPNPKDAQYNRRVYICVGENGNNVHSVYKEIDNINQVNTTVDTIRTILSTTKPFKIFSKPIHN